MTRAWLSGGVWWSTGGPTSSFPSKRDQSTHGPSTKHLEPAHLRHVVHAHQLFRPVGHSPPPTSSLRRARLLAPLHICTRMRGGRGTVGGVVAVPTLLWSTGLQLRPTGPVAPRALSGMARTRTHALSMPVSVPSMPTAAGGPAVRCPLG